jgi:hypothetical protein
MLYLFWIIAVYYDIGSYLVLSVEGNYFRPY